MEQMLCFRGIQVLPVGQLEGVTELNFIRVFFLWKVQEVFDRQLVQQVINCTWDVPCW